MLALEVMKLFLELHGKSLQLTICDDFCLFTMVVPV
jgi:hypothetical protein